MLNEKIDSTLISVKLPPAAGWLRLEQRLETGENIWLNWNIKMTHSGVMRDYVLDYLHLT